jgi:hypothetical protein
MGKNLARKAVEQLSHVVFLSLLASNHCFAFPKSENGKRWSSMASLVTPLMVKVLQISRKCWRWALISSCAFPQNWLDCTMFMRAGLSSNPLSPTLIADPVQMLVIVGAENSRRVLLAIASNYGVKLHLIYLYSDSKAETFLSLALVLLINASESSM